MFTSLRYDTSSSTNIILRFLYSAASRFTISILVLGLILLSIITTEASAQDEREGLRFRRQRSNTSEGTEFYLCFQRNYRDSRQSQRDTKSEISLELFITSSVEAHVEIEIKELAFRRKITIPAGTVVQVKIDSAAQITGMEIIQQRAVHITSDAPVSVYGLNHRFQTTDTFLGLPVSVLGREYRVVGYSDSEGLMSQFAVVATEDGTEVSITPTVLTSENHQPFAPIVVQLKAGDVYQVGASAEALNHGDLTGSLITSTKKIAVFSGHQCAYVPNPLIGCNFLAEQLPPISAWGEDFYVGLLQGRATHTVRVVASEPSTSVFANSALVATLNAGEFYDNSKVHQNLHITTTKPALVAQYSPGFSNGDSLGDPMMMLISPTQQFLKEYRFATPISGEWNHYINVVIPTKSLSSLWLDEKQVNAGIFQPTGSGEYSFATIKIEFGSHSIKADDAFGLSSYGFGYRSQAYDSYGNIGGQAFFGTQHNLVRPPSSK